MLHIKRRVAIPFFFFVCNKRVRSSAAPLYPFRIKAALNYTADRYSKRCGVEYVSCEPSDSLKELFPERYGVCGDSFEGAETEQA